MLDAPGGVLHMEGSQQLTRQIKVGDLVARVDVVDLSDLASVQDGVEGVCSIPREEVSPCVLAIPVDP